MDVESVAGQGLLVALGAALTLIVGAFADRRSREHADSAWRRDQRLRASSQLIEAVYRFDEAVVELVRTWTPDGDLWSRHEECVASLNQVALRHAQLEVLGPATLADLGEELTLHLYMHLESVNSNTKITEVLSRFKAGTWDEAKTTKRLVTEFTKAARRALGGDAT